MSGIFKKVMAGMVGAAMLFSANIAWAGPTVGMTITNNWSADAVNNPRDCLAAVNPAFTIVSSGGQLVTTAAGSGGATSVFICEVQYAKATSSSTYCRFRISRTRTVNSTGGYWNAPTVIVTRGGSGINCTYTIGGNPLDPAGDFSISMNLNN